MWLALSSLLGASGVALGAYGTHALSDRVSEAAAASWNTATEYHLLHAIALLALALHARATGRPVRLPAALLAAGVVLFSGSIYLLVLAGWRWLGPITPLGGLVLVAGWVSLLAGARTAQAR
jgi:uncharacterized membrane protein YgdD (TMEM256/DUF423 family)